MTGGRLWLSRSALVAALLLLPASSGLSAESSPGAVPPQCGDDPTVLQAGGEPTPGLDGPAPGGCLIQSWAATFALSPHVLHVGQKLTGTVETTGKLNGVGWSWSNFTAEMQLGSHKPRLHCADNAPTCTVIVGPNVVSSVYQVYSQGLNTPLGGAVSSDYFIVNNDLQELSGRVDYQNDGKRTPAAGIELAARTGRRAEHASTGPDGKYSFVLHRGNYSVSVVGKEAQPSSHEVSLGANVSGVDFLTGCIGHPTFVVVHVKQGAETTFGYQGTNWDVGGCGPVTVGAVGEKGPVQELQRTYTTDEFKFAARGKGRFCGADFFAQQPQSGRSLKAGWTSGHSTAAHVVFANPTLDANGEDLFPGDVLCEQDLGSAVGAVDSGNIDGATVTAIAQHLGLKTLAIQVGQDVVMADSEGKVSVSGESGQHISSEQIASLQANVSGGASELPASVNGNASLSGAQQSKGSYTVNGNLNLASGVLVIHGDLTVTGTITGSGAVFATGNITAAGANLTSDDRYGLVAGGSLNLP